MAACAACGNIVAPEDKFCRVCGRQLIAVPAASATAPGVPSPGIPSPPPATSGKAVASLIFGLLFFIPLAFVAAIVFGHVALSEIKRSAGRLTGGGMAIAGLVLGYLWIVGIPIFLIIAAIAIPNLLRARQAANEASAVASIRTLNVAEVAYSTEHSNAGFTCSLSDLSSLIDHKLVDGQKSGYVFQLSGCTAGESGAIVKYQVVAHPITPNTTGARAFCSDEDQVIRVDSNGSPQGCLESGTVLQ